MNQDTDDRLENVLDRELEVASQLVTALAAERSALTGPSPTAVEERAADKVRLLGTIENLENERRALWETPDSDASGTPAGVVDRWRALMGLVAECRTANEVNGHIINVRQSQIQQLLDILRGATTPITYGPQGKPFANPPRPLALA